MSIKFFQAQVGHGNPRLFPCVKCGKQARFIVFPAVGSFPPVVNVVNVGDGNLCRRHAEAEAARRSAAAEAAEWEAYKAAEAAFEYGS